jgi:hypothetical protein
MERVGITDGIMIMYNVPRGTSHEYLRAVGP